jgi:ubiquitin carboxyl-terminal hydrolase 16/45
VEEEVREKAKAYGRQAAEMMLHPEQVFRGFLVSTLECQDCLNSSQRVESFLDLSLPVMADKVKSYYLFEVVDHSRWM